MTKRTKRILEWFFIIIIALCVLILGILLSYQQVYAGRIYRNVYFGSIDLSGLSQKQAEKLLESKIKDFAAREFTITCGDKKIKAKIGDTGLSFSSKEIIEKLYNAGRGQNFWSNLKNSSNTLLSKTIIRGKPTIEQKAFNSFMEIAVKQLNIDPVDASLKIKDGAIQEIQSQDGQIANTDGLAEKIVEMVLDGRSSIQLEPVTENPKIKSSDFTNAKRGAQLLLDKKITFTYQTSKFEPSKAEIGSWIIFTEKDGTYEASFDRSNIKAYLNRIARFEVQKIDRKVTDTGEVLQEGRDGIYLDKDFVVNRLLEQDSSQISLELTTQTESRKEIIVLMKSGVELGRSPGKYIDVNLSTQSFCRVDGTTLIDCFLTSTGKPSTPTPVGSFAITRKNPRGWAPNPGVWMPWFQEFKAGGYGIHELVEWPDGHHEDISHLGQTISHGCVRLGPGVAEMVFNWTEIGTPVYVHK